MNKLRLFVLIATTGLTLQITLDHSVHAAAGTLKSPGVALPSNYPPEASKKIIAALQRKDCKFLKGSWINWHTSMLYTGKTRALNLFIDDLVKCPGITVSVRLKKLSNDCDWVVSHDTYGRNRFEFSVNLNSDNIDLEKLVFPEAKGPSLQSLSKKDPDK